MTFYLEVFKYSGGNHVHTFYNTDGSYQVVMYTRITKMYCLWYKNAYVYL